MAQRVRRGRNRRGGSRGRGRRRNEQLGLSFDVAPSQVASVEDDPRVTPQMRAYVADMYDFPPTRADVWEISQGGPAPHRYSPDIPPLDKRKLPSTFQGHNLGRMENGDYVMWPVDAEPPVVRGKGSKAKWQYEKVSYTSKGKEKREWKTAIGGGRVGAKGKTGQFNQGGLNDDQLQAIQFAASLKGTPEQRAKSLIRQNALYAINHSAGKDSQAMFLYLHRELGLPAGQTVILHADLPGQDWPRVNLPGGLETPNIQEHIERTVDGMPFRVVVARWGTTSKTPEDLRGKVKTFHGYVRHRYRVRPDAPSFPSASTRWCTSDLKAGPLNKAIAEELCVRNGLRTLDGEKSPSKCNVSDDPWRIVVSCEGIRAAESTERSQYEPWELDIDRCKNGRIWFTYLPIFDWTAKTDADYKSEATDVTDYILRMGQRPFWTYGATPEDMKLIKLKAPGAEHGISRLSCQFCFYASPKDQALTRQLDPDAYDQMCALEKETGYSLSMGGETLEERTSPLVPASALTRKLSRKVNPWQTFKIKHPSGRMPNEAFDMYDLMLADILTLDTPTVAGAGMTVERETRPKKGKPRRKTMRKLKKGETPPPGVLSTTDPSVTLVPAQRSARGQRSWTVLSSGVEVGGVDQMRLGKQTKYAARTRFVDAETDRIDVEMFDNINKAIAKVLERWKYNQARGRHRNAARRNQPLRSNMSDNDQLAALKRKLMR